MSRIREFPPDHELLAFFEAEPTLSDTAVPWTYNTLDFATTRGGIEVRCRFAPSYGNLTACLLAADMELARFELCGAEAFRLVADRGYETLVVTFPGSLLIDRFVLQLKPRVWAGWGNANPILQS